jgi:hypothetical protein
MHGLILRYVSGVAAVVVRLKAVDDSKWIIATTQWTQSRLTDFYVLAFPRGGNCRAG